MKPFCQTCQHWRRNNEYYRNLDYGKCLCSKLFNGHRIKQEKYPTDGLVVWQGAGMYAVLETGAYFSCCHHRLIDKGDLE